MDRRAALDWLGLRVQVMMDRPMGSRHPSFDFIYPVNYGHLHEVWGGDGEEQDAYVLGVDEPLVAFEGVVIAVVLRENDGEDKLVVAAQDSALSRAEITAAIAFQEQYFKSRVVLPGDRV